MRTQTPENQEKLKDEFTKLTAEIQRSVETANRDRFTQKLTLFRLNVRVFLTFWGETKDSLWIIWSFILIYFNIYYFNNILRYSSMRPTTKDLYLLFKLPNIWMVRFSLLIRVQYHCLQSSGICYQFTSLGDCGTFQPLSWKECNNTILLGIFLFSYCCGNFFGRG